MQILYVIGILVLSVFTIESLVTSESMNINTNATYKAQTENLKVTWKLSQAARIAYETSVKNSGACPAGTTAYSPEGTANVTLCWNSDLDDDCFNNVLSSTGRKICLKAPPITTASLFFPVAYANTTAPHTVTYGVSNGVATHNASPMAHGPSQNGAFVRLPPPNAAGVINSNHVDCNTNYTECFSIIYCNNGTTTCAPQNQIVQTFATRWF